MLNNLKYYCKIFVGKSFSASEGEAALDTNKYKLYIFLFINQTK